MIEEIQVKLGVVGHEKGPLTALQQTAEVLRRLRLVHSLRQKLRIGNPGQLHDEGGQNPSLRQADQHVQTACLRARLQTDGAQLDDAVLSERNAGGLRVEDHNPVKLLPKLLHQAAPCSSGQLSPVA